MQQPQDLSVLMTQFYEHQRMASNAFAQLAGSYEALVKAVEASQKSKESPDLKSPEKPQKTK